MTGLPMSSNSLQKITVEQSIGGGELFECISSGLWGNRKPACSGIQSYTKCRFFNLMKELAGTNLFVD